MEKNFRMYFLILRHLSGVNKAVQSSHSSFEYSLKYINNEDFIKYAANDKTIIMLDGGTHQDMVESQKILEENGINHAYFLEPDINNSMTSICFLVEDSIYDREKFKTYEDFYDEYLENYGYIREDINLYDKWIESIGGKQNEFIHNLIKNKKLSL